MENIILASLIALFIHTAAGLSPYHVSLKTVQGVYFCAGAIIKERWILTAAHCVIDEKPEYISVVVGRSTLNDGGVIYEIHRIVNHGGYNRETDQNDISLLQTTQYIQFTEFIKPIALPTSNTGQGIRVTLNVWSVQNNGTNEAANYLQSVDLHTISNELCSTRLYNASIFGPNQLCTDGQGNRACKAETGSPLVAGDELIGIVSYGNSCAQTIVFTRVYSYISWIRRYIGF